MKKLFGTDGIRGKIGSEINGMLAYNVGKSVAELGKKLLIGRDTRASGIALSKAFCMGAVSIGAKITDVGIATTPCVAYLTKALGYDYGIVISASHNDKTYNGIKIFDENGEKLSEKDEETIEDLIRRYLDFGENAEDVGKMTTLEDGIATAFGENRKNCENVKLTENSENTSEKAENTEKVSLLAENSEKTAKNNSKQYENNSKPINEYVKFLCSKAKDFTGLKIGLDCANGASGAVAKDLFSALGASVIITHCEQDGERINEHCGALNPQNIAKTVVENGCDIGFAFDGDADRVICALGSGRQLDGDEIIYLLAKVYKTSGDLVKNKVVGTVQTNLGIEKALEENGIQLIRADVGDKYVYEILKKEGLTVGGEQAGHIIFASEATTGDGLLTAIKILNVVVTLKDADDRSGENVAKTIEKMLDYTLFPQENINVNVKDKYQMITNRSLAKTIENARKTLASDGRVIVRPSGTEHKIRITVESPSGILNKTLAKKIADCVISLDNDLN